MTKILKLEDIKDILEVKIKTLLSDLKQEELRSYRIGMADAYRDVLSDLEELLHSQKIKEKEDLEALKAQGVTQESIDASYKLNIINDEDDEKIRCYFCNKDLEGRCNHLANLYDNVFKSICGDCYRKFSKEQDYQLNIKYAEEDGETYCHFCKRKLDGEYIYRAKVYHHHFKNMCGTCYKIFLQRHE